MFARALATVLVSIAFVSVAGCSVESEGEESATGSGAEAISFAPMGFARITAAGGVVTQFNGSSATSPTVAHPSAGRYSVSFPALGGAGGHVQVVAEGANNYRCRVENWNSAVGGAEKVNVRCHRPDGTAVDAAFAVLFYRQTKPSTPLSFATRGAYLWVNSAGGVDPNYDYNSSGYTNTVAKTGTGSYTVTITNARYANAGMMVTAYGTTGAQFCSIGSWSAGTNLTAYVRCWNASGALADSAFTFAYGTNGPTLDQQGGHAWFDGSGTPAAYASGLGKIQGCSVANVSGSRSGSLATVVVQGDLGSWDANPFRRASFVTAYGGASYCKPESLSASGVAPSSTGSTTVRCYDAAGAILATPVFTLTHVTSDASGPC